MLRWFRKLQQRNVSCKSQVATIRKDEYGFDGQSFPSHTEHIYEEINDVPERNHVVQLDNCVTKPELPPRNNRSVTTRGSYSQWKFESLSRKSLSLPVLTAREPNESAKKSKEKTEIKATGTIVICNVREARQTQCSPLPKHREVYMDDLVTNCVPTTPSLVRHYLPTESDSGYDYSGSSSNGSEINDIGACSSYEFHLSKAEQLRKLEQEIQSISSQSEASLSESDRYRKSVYNKRQHLLKEKLWNESSASLSSSASFTSDLDFDDETLAFGDRYEFSINTLKSDCAKSLRRQKGLSPAVRQNRRTEKVVKINSKTPATDKCTVKQQPSPTSETIQYYRSSNNRLLGDLIRKNNDNLFFA